MIGNNSTAATNGKEWRTAALAVICLVGLMSLLLGMNYYSQWESQQKTLQRIQADVTEKGRRVDDFLIRLNCDVERLAGSQEVDTFFKSRALGMSMAYGLRASLTNIRRGFERRVQLSHVGHEFVYNSIALLDSTGETLISWPDDPPGDPPAELIEAVGGVASSTLHVAHEGYFCLQFPIVNGDAVQGFILASIPYQALYDQLHSDGKTAKKFIFHAGRLVYPESIENDKSDLIWAEIRQQPFSYHVRGSALRQKLQQRGFDKPLQFFVTLPNFLFTIYQLEDADDLYNPTATNMLLVAMLLFSVTIIVFSLRLVRTSTRNLALYENLHDVRDREEALKEKNQEMELIITGAELGTWQWDVRTGEIVINEQWAAMLGYQQDELNLDMATWSDWVHPADRDLVDARLADHLAGKTKLYSVDYRLRHKSGKWIWVHKVSQVFNQDMDGNPLSVRGVQLEITELVEAKRTAEKAREEADSVIANFLDSLLVVDQQLRISRVNNATCLLLGYEQYQLLGKPISAFFSDPCETVEDYFTFPQQPVYADTTELRNIELSFKRADGAELPVSINLARLNNEQGETVGVVAGAKDISALKQVLHETEKQKQFIESVLNIIPGGLLVTGTDFRLLQSNRTFDLQIAKWSNKYQLEPDGLRELILSQLAEGMLQAASGGFCLCCDQGAFYVEYHASEGSEKDSFNRVVFLSDVTERHQAEAARKLQSTVLEQTSDAVIVTDTSGNILFANNAASEISGFTSAEMLGQKSSIFHNDAHYQQLWETILAGEVWKGSMTNRKKDGSLFETETTISPVRNEKGIVTNYVALWRDVSHERAMQRQLTQVQKMEAVGQLAAGVAHEINTPIQYIHNNVSFFQTSFAELSAILDHLQLLIADPRLAGEQQWLETFEVQLADCDLEFLREEVPLSLTESLQGIDQVAKIVSAMKEFSHPGNAEKVPTNLNKLIENAVVVTRNEWKYAATLETDLAADLPLLTCDPGSWSQILLNMIVNSAQAIAEAEPKGDGLGLITLTTRQTGNVVELKISDTGGGISEEALTRIYEPFFTTKDVGKGTGQGLAIVYDFVVNKHQGSIDCESEVGQGTTFIIRVPLNDQTPVGER